MEIIIRRLDDLNIFTVKDYSDVRDRGEIAHIIAELEIIKQDLLELWMEYKEDVKR